jgi:regulator of RNase E activity RraA
MMPGTPEPLKPEELETLSKWPTCAIANAIEAFNIRPRNVGFMGPEIECQFPDLPIMAGYAVTGVIAADSPEGRRVSPFEWWEYIQKIPAPRIVVLHDLDKQPIGSFWGEVNGNVHKALGCIGTVTDGSVRDLDEVHDIGFHFFSSCVTVSHAYIHMVEYGIPVKVGGLTVKPGDILVGDKHGVIEIPREIARELPAKAQAIEDWERRVINYCKTKDFKPEELKKLYNIPRPY